MTRMAMTAPTGAVRKWRGRSPRPFQGCTAQPSMSAARSAFSVYSILTSSTSRAMTMPAFKFKTIFGGVALVVLRGMTASAWAVWPTDIGGIKEDLVTASVVGPSGDVFVAGTFSGEATLGSDTRLNARGTRDIFVARYNAAGNLVWAQRAGGKYADSVNDIAADASGNVYVTGGFTNKADFGAIDVESEKPEESDIYVAKLDGAGEWVWVSTGRGSRDDAANAIGLIEGNPSSVPPVSDLLIIGGFYKCEAKFEPIEENASASDFRLTSPSCGEDAKEQHFLAAVDSDGIWRWTMDAGSTGSASSVIESMHVKNGRLFVVGRHDDEINLGGSILEAPPDKPHDYILSDPWEIIESDSVGQDYSLFRPSRTSDKLSTLELEHDLDLTGLNEPALTFRHRHSIERAFYWPGSGFGLQLMHGLAYMEYSVNEGQSWASIPSDWLMLGGYNSFNGAANNPYANSNAGWTLTSQNYPETNTVRVNLESLGTEDKVRFRWTYAEIPDNAWFYTTSEGWWIDTVALVDGQAEVYSGSIEKDTKQFVARVSNPASSSPQWSWAQSVKFEFVINDIHVDNEGQPLVAGTVTESFIPWGKNTPVENEGAAVARLDDNNDGSVDWIEVAQGGEASSLVAVDDDVYFAGQFAGSIKLRDGEGGSLTSTGQRDLFVAKVSNVSGSPSVEWVSGGDEYVPGGVPGQAGGAGDAFMTGIATDGLANLYVTGGFTDSLIFGKEAELVAADGQNGFVANLDLFGSWFEVESWMVGERITPPSNAMVSDQSATPEIVIDGSLASDDLGTKFFWAKPAGADQAQLTVLDALDGVEIHWRVEGEPLSSSNRIVQVGRTGWPGEACTSSSDSQCYQAPVAGAPVELDEAGSGYRFVSQFPASSQASDAEVNASVLKAEQPGFSVLMYGEGDSSDPYQNPVAIEVVRTFRPSQTPGYVNNIRWDIGEPIVDAYHNQIGRAGFVLNENAFYDGTGPDAAYDREARTGHIIAVNKTRPTRIQDAGKDMTIAWYRRNAKGIYWPQRAMQYQPDWPLDPDRIIIASEQGGEVLGQAPLSPQEYQDLRIYQQPLVSEPGYNPNATHAFFAPSNTGSGILALFALRADFGLNLPDDLTAATDPYVLVKYWNDDLDRWAFRTYYVTATGAGFDKFEYGGVAGTAVAPPYPLSTLPGCDDTRAVGQAINDPQPPPPFFKDYKNGLWSKSAGQGQILFWYPLQPGFAYDITNNDFPDVDTGQCVPWMARLPEEIGGTSSPNEPVAVSYNFSWPADPPQLIPGESLLKQKRGLPNIFEQDAVEVIFDEHREDMEATGGAEPEDTLVQLIDPLNPRFVYLENLDGLGSELDPETGHQIIVGDADGLMNLPVSIRERLRYDSLNKRLVFSGQFDDTIAGEPLLLVNIMSFREARQLKVIGGAAEDEAEDSTNQCLDAGEPGKWAEAVEALFRLTRNPNGIETICVDSQINPGNGKRERLLSS